MKNHSQDDDTPSGNSKVSLSDVKNYFSIYKSFFYRLSAIESKLSLSISPSLLNNLPREDQQDIDELYLLLFEKQVIRLNAKLTCTDSTAITLNHTDTALSIGDKIALTFLSTIEFNFLQQKVTLHTANLLVNAIVKDLQEESGAVKVLYGDTDSRPMYIAYSAFETQEEAKEEASNIMQHEKTYIDASTGIECAKKFYPN